MLFIEPFKAYWLRDAPPVLHSTTVRSSHASHAYIIN
jgi:hypothetical protein